MTDVTAAYSQRAGEYIGLLGSMDKVHPSDRQLVDTWAGGLTGPVLDAGCGPGHWTDHLTRRGLDVVGVDRVPAFLDHARSTYPGVPFRIGTIDALSDPDASLGGVMSWYSTIHHEPARIAAPLAEFARVLRPDGGLLLGFFSGPTVEQFDHAVAPAYRWPPSVLEGLLEDHGFEVIETHTRTGRTHRPLAAVVCRRGVSTDGSPGRP
jgi:SAM-dependent methyltransferase